MGVAEHVPQGLRAGYRKLGRARWPTKAWNLRHYGPGDLSLGQRVRYVTLDPEVDNFTYPIANSDELASWVATELSVDSDEIRGYLAELRDLEPLLRVPLSRRLWAPPRYQLGRRAGWYAICRALKPEVVVETGMHDGLGSLTLLSALKRNAADGRDGTLLSFDPLPGTGWLVPDELQDRWEPHHETSDHMEERLNGRRVGLFIHDSLHTYEVERAELETAWANRGARLVLLSDNAHVTDAMRDTAAEHDLSFSYWQERPARHFYPGGGIGLAR